MNLQLIVKLLFIVIFGLSCNNNKNHNINTNLEQDKLIYDVKDSLISTKINNMQEIKMDSTNWKLIDEINNKISNGNIETYINIGNPDTALSMFLVLKYKNINFDIDDQVAYMRYDYNYIKINNLIREIYYNLNNLDNIIYALENQRSLFRNFIKTEFNNFYINEDYVDDIYLDYLISVNDTFYIPILKDVLKRNIYTEEENKEIREILNKKSRHFKKGYDYYNN